MCGHSSLYSRPGGGGAVVRVASLDRFTCSGIPIDASSRGGYNSDDITKVGGGGGLLSQEAVMTE